MRCLTTTIAIVALLAPASASAVDYDAAFREAKRLEAAEQFAQAAAALEPVAEAFPQDYAVHLQLGWLYFQAGDYERAEQAYRIAHDLSDGSLESSLGLGWTKLRQEQLDEARRHFTAVQAEAPDNESAAEGLALVASMEKPKASWSYAAYAGLVGELYSEPAFGSTTTGAGAAGSAGVGYGPFATSVTYQYMLYQTPETTSSGSGSGEMHGRETTTTRSEQRHELHASAAWAKKSWGVSLHYGGAFSDALLNGNAFGVVGRVSPLGDVTLEASYATFDDGVGVARVTPAWRIPIGPRFFVTPGAAFQADDEGRARGAGLLNAGLDTDSVTAVLGGRVGRQYRAVYFAVPSIQSVEGVEQYSAWASLAAGLGGGWEAVVAYVFSRFEPVAGSTEPFDEHTASIGIRKPIW